MRSFPRFEGLRFLFSMLPLFVVACSPSSSPSTGDTNDASATTPTSPAYDGGPIACGSKTCTGGEVCVHECCDVTPCAPMEDDGGCWTDSHAVPEGSGEVCAGGCIVNDPQCLPSDTCQEPPSGCTGPDCPVGCD